MNLVFPLEGVFALLVFAAIPLIFAVILIVRGWHAHDDVIRSQSWATAPARKLRVRLTTDVGISQTRFVVNVSYSYEAEGKRYRGDCVAIGYEGSSDYESEEELANQLRDTRGLLVRYDPQNPQQSCLTCITPSRAFSHALAGVPALMLLIGLMWLTWYFSGNDVLLRSLEVK